MRDRPEIELGVDDISDIPNDAVTAIANALCDHPIVDGDYVRVPRAFGDDLVRIVLTEARRWNSKTNPSHPEIRE